MANGTVHFLLVYSFEKQELVEQKEFSDAKLATAAYNDVEREYRGNRNYEIVLVGSDSLETIMKTHGHYFRNASDSLFSEFLSASV